MFKLYLKKLLLGFLIPVLILIVYFMGFSILYTFANFFEKESIIWQLILFGIPTVIALIIIYFMRVNNRKNRTQYMIDLPNDSKFSFLKDIIYILKSKDFISEILACATVCLPFEIIVGVVEKTPPLSLIIGTIILTGISILIFSVIDIPLWVLVHKRWIED